MTSAKRSHPTHRAAAVRNLPLLKPVHEILGGSAVRVHMLLWCCQPDLGCGGSLAGISDDVSRKRD
jgi:hypothetical protein